ncbi:hypothetical protein QQ045_006606 [Rhodiola kirilowii]
MSTPQHGYCHLYVESVNCDSCTLTEECTPKYIAEVRERYNGRWICGLCAEAVKDEVKDEVKMISTEEALHRHINFCKEFRATDPISEIGKILRKILESR